jgi:putative SOS response-associated peptidase YedK
MCERFALTASPAALATLFDLREISDFSLRYSVAPPQTVAAVRTAAAGGRELAFLRWGLIPSWATDSAIGANLINARADTVNEKAAFRSAFLRRRCLIPADGFLEWVKGGNRKQPYLVRRKDSATLALAGLWEWWQSPEGAEIETCTILTTAANTLVWHFRDRMPVIID